MILTLLVLFVFLIGVFCTIIYNLRGQEEEGWYYAAFFPMLIGGICLLFCIGQISTRELFAKSYVVKIDAIRETFESARVDENIHSLELATIQLKVAEKNVWIANAKFWANQPLTNWFWSKKILEIKPIK